MPLLTCAGRLTGTHIGGDARRDQVQVRSRTVTDAAWGAIAERRISLGGRSRDRGAVFQMFRGQSA
jgi:hypothetical protein